VNFELCDCCQKKFYGADLEKAELINALKMMVEYFETELGWAHFRAEFMTRGDVEYGKSSLRNAAIITKALESFKSSWPEIAAYLDKVKPITL